MCYRVTPISSREGDESTGPMHFCLSPVLFHRVCSHWWCISALGPDLLDLCHVQPAPLLRFLWVDPPGCSRHILDVFCTSSCSRPVSRNRQVAGFKLSQANLPIITCQKSTDHRLNRVLQSHCSLKATRQLQISRTHAISLHVHISLTSVPPLALC